MGVIGDIVKRSTSCTVRIEDIDFEKIVTCNIADKFRYYEGVVKNIDHDYNNKRLPGIKIRRDFERDLFMQDVVKEIS